MHPALIISLLGTYVPAPCGSAGAQTYFVQVKAGVLALAYVCARECEPIAMPRRYGGICVALRGERELLSHSESNQPAVLCTNKQGTAINTDIKHIPLWRMCERVCVCVINTCLRTKERRERRRDPNSAKKESFAAIQNVAAE